MLEEKQKTLIQCHSKGFIAFFFTTNVMDGADSVGFRQWANLKEHFKHIYVYSLFCLPQLADFQIWGMFSSRMVFPGSLLEILAAGVESFVCFLTFWLIPVHNWCIGLGVERTQWCLARNFSLSLFIFIGLKANHSILNPLFFHSLSEHNKTKNTHRGSL